MNKEYKITKATTNDIVALSLLLSELFGMEEEFTPDEKAQQKGLEYIIQNPQIGQIFVLKKDENIIGMVNLLFSISTALGSKVAILEDVIIKDEFRAKGLGKLLINHAIDFCKENEIKRITLLTDDSNKKAQQFYSKLNFEKSPMIVMRNIL